MRILALACVLAALGCQGPTEVLLFVQTDLDESTLAYVEIATGSDVGAHLVTDGDGGGSQPCICVSPTACPGEAVAFPLTVPLEPGKQGTAPFQVEALAHIDAGCGDPAKVRDSAVLSFVPHERLGVYLALDAKCIGVVCDDGATCSPTTGTCVPNETTPVAIGHDASVVDAGGGGPDLSVVQDLALPPPDMTLPPYFQLATLDDGDWAIASAGTDFSLILLNDGQVSYGPAVPGFPTSTPMPASTDMTDYVDVCVASDKGTYFYALETSDSVFAYEPTTSGDPGPVLQQYDAPSSFDLACAEGSSGNGQGVTLAWIAASLIEGKPAQLSYVRKLDDALTDTPTTIPADDFVLAPSGTATILLHPSFARTGGQPIRNARPPEHAPSNADLGTGGTCGYLELYQLFDENVGFVPASPTAAAPEGSPCVDIDPGQLYAVAPVGAQVLVGGEGLDRTDPALELGIPPTFTEPQPYPFAQVAMAPLGAIAGSAASGDVAVAVVYEPLIAFQQVVRPQELHLYRTTATGTVLDDQILSRTVDGSSPVKIAVNAAGTVLVTWIEPIGGESVLVGELVTP